jgi:preprotein translocase subunit SecE
MRAAGAGNRAIFGWSCMGPGAPPGPRPGCVFAGATEFGGLLEFPARYAYLTPSIRDQGKIMAARTNPFQFIQQVRAEVGKVVWPTRREVLVTTTMVFIMAALTAAFFFLVDLIIRTGLTQILTFFG